MSAIDYTPFDIPEISMMAFYPQRVWAPPPAGAEDVMVPVAPGVELSGRFYRHDPSAPTILFFHGNGEVAYMYDDIAPTTTAPAPTSSPSTFAATARAAARPASPP